LFLENLSFGRRVQKSIQQKKEQQEIRRLVGSKLAAYTILICNAQLIDLVLPFALKPLQHSSLLAFFHLQCPPA
jgi:hypothetical protein